jgi:HD-GYP domain-containing protein (c-di-GMP phosphodiesterase class II)
MKLYWMIQGALILKQRNEKSLTELFKQHITLIIAIISTVIIAIFVLIFLNLNKNYSNNILINILGRQRMLTQMMAKDAGRIYELKSIISGNVKYENDEINLQERLTKTINEINTSVKEYEKQYNTIKQGYILSEGKKLDFNGVLNNYGSTIIEHEKIWGNFKASINTVVNEDINSPEYVQAIRYIYENNQALLTYSDQITTDVLNYSNKKSLIVYYSVIGLAILLLLALALFIRRAYKSVFIPVSQLSKGVAELGLIIEDNQEEQEEKIDLAPVFSEVKTVLNQFNSLILLMENLSKNVPFKEVLANIYNTFLQYIPYTHIGVALIDEDRKIITASYAASGQYHENLHVRILGSKVALKETSLSSIVESGKERIINDLEEYVKGKPLKDYNKVLLEEGIRASITFPLKNNNEVIGIIFFSSNTKNVYKNEHIRFLRTLANSISLSLEKDIFIEDMIISSTLALAKLTEERDNETGEHLQRMKIYSRMIAEFLSKEEKYKGLIDVSYINNIERFAPLHDVGKVAIRDEILLKPGKLTKEEFEIMKTHATYGAKVLRLADDSLKKKGRSIFKLAIQIAEGHHEKWDGSGYPYGKSGEAIPLSARIVAMADVFDALTSERPYKKPFSFEDSVKIITEGKGKQFDPEIIDIFMKNIEVIKDKYLEFKEQNIDVAV